MEYGTCTLRNDANAIEADMKHSMHEVEFIC